MYFGYAWVESAAPAITELLAARRTPEELGELFRDLRSPSNALIVTAGIWMYLMGTLGRELTGEPWSPAVAGKVLGYWHRVYEAYTALCDPPSRVPERGANYSAFRVLDRARADELAAAVTPNAGGAARAALAACANYSWLLECESRQGVFSHGLYPCGDGRQLLVREFVNLAGEPYPWVDDTPALPRDPIAIVLALRDVDARFDAFGVAALQPESYAEHIAGAAVITADGVAPDPDAAMAALIEATGAAHLDLFRVIATWSARDRFLAGARSYARIWADALACAGASAAAIDELVYGSLDRFAEERLAEHIERDEPAPIWPWVAAAGRPSVFSPVLNALPRG
jgi:hypothetical protein